MNEFDYDYDYGCPHCCDTICDQCVDDPVDREERDYINGYCRECEEWGQFQCRIHADVYFDACRAEDARYRLLRASRLNKRRKIGRKARFRLYAAGSS